MARKKSTAQLEAELREARRAGRFEVTASVMKSLISWGGISVVCYWGYRAIEVLAGRSTTAVIGVDFLTNVKVNAALAWTLGGGGMVYGGLQRKLRKDTIQRLQGRIRELETTLDPKRSSSRLTERGDTPAGELP